ncbi:MAG: hypothetical protein H0U90_02775 [Actinobacteria bacterium]|nr:hypothetical protein [Actinomycetota bacterium]
MATKEELYSTPAIRLASATRPAFVLIAVVGAVVGVTADWQPGAILMIGGVAGALVAQLVVGIVAYRRAMRTPWPDVPPVVDDDWD